MYVVFCKELWDEWKKHNTIFSSTWLASMNAKKRIIWVNINNKLSEHLGVISKLYKRELSALQKDVHLIETAAKAEKFIISNDAIAKNILCKIANDLPSSYIQGLFWAVVSQDSEALIKLIKKAGYIPEKFEIKLSNFDESIKP